MKSIANELEGEDAILDGEIVVLNEEGKSQFYDLMFNRSEPVFAAFDILWLDGEDLRNLPLVERKSILEGCLKKPSERVLYVVHIEREGRQLYKEVCAVGCECVVLRAAERFCGAVCVHAFHYVLRTPRWRLPRRWTPARVGARR